MLSRLELLLVAATCAILGIGIASAFFLAFWILFVAIVVLAMWDSQSEIRKLKARIAELENKPPTSS